MVEACGKLCTKMGIAGQKPLILPLWMGTFSLALGGERPTSRNATSEIGATSSAKKLGRVPPQAHVLGSAPVHVFTFTTFPTASPFRSRPAAEWANFPRKSPELAPSGADQANLGLPPLDVTVWSAFGLNSVDVDPNLGQLWLDVAQD